MPVIRYNQKEELYAKTYSRNLSYVQNLNQKETKETFIVLLETILQQERVILRTQKFYQFFKRNTQMYFVSKISSKIKTK